MSESQEFGALAPQQFSPELSLTKSPERVLAEAQRAADALKDLVIKKGLFKKIGTKEHLFVEAWQTLGVMYGVTSKIASTESVQIGDAVGFKARAEAVLVSTGQVISSGEALCLNDEDNWNMRPVYEWPDGKKTKVGEVRVPTHQLMSMAETRAISKALRNVLSWIVALAGYDPTPAEEMTGAERSAQARPPVQQPKRKSKPESGLITGIVEDIRRSKTKGKGNDFCALKLGHLDNAIHIFDNCELPLKSGGSLKAFDLLKEFAKGQECTFLVESEEKGGKSFVRIKKILRIGPMEWDEEGLPVYQTSEDMNQGPS